MDIAMFPNTCAPLNGDAKNPGWSQCSENCTGCIKCVPNMDTTCGQMVAASGIECVPKGCIAECCTKTLSALHSIPRHQKVIGVIVALMAIICVVILVIILKKRV